MNADAAAGRTQPARTPDASAPFVTALRSRPGVVRVAGDGGPRITIRVELPELWDTIAFDAPGTLSARALKREALAMFGLGHTVPEEFVLKLRGFEVLDEDASLAAGGALDGSTYLLTYRRRRPVR